MIEYSVDLVGDISTVFFRLSIKGIHPIISNTANKVNEVENKLLSIKLIFTKIRIIVYYLKFFVY
jgi:hypothetical protein